MRRRHCCNWHVTSLYPCSKGYYCNQILRDHNFHTNILTSLEYFTILPCWPFFRDSVFLYSTIL
jgi:hypothetical protein